MATNAKKFLKAMDEQLNLKQFQADLQAWHDAPEKSDMPLDLVQRVLLMSAVVYYVSQAFPFQHQMTYEDSMLFADLIRQGSSLTTEQLMPYLDEAGAKAEVIFLACKQAAEEPTDHSDTAE